jgi:hypothetical protein
MDLKNLGRNAFLALLLVLVLAVILGPREHGTVAVVAICFLLVDIALVIWFVQRRRHP